MFSLFAGVEVWEFLRLEFVKVRGEAREYCSGVSSHNMSTFPSSEVMYGSELDVSELSQLVGWILEEDDSLSI